MKPTDFLSGIVHLFNDLIGAIVPGIILVIGLYQLHYIPDSKISQLLKLDVSVQWLLGIAIFYVIGHALLSLHRILKTFLEKPLKAVSSLLKLKKPDHKGYEEKISGSSPYKGFLKVIEEAVDSKTKESMKYEFNFGNLRSMAMSVSKEAGGLARRFMFISLFCYGISMAILVLSVIYLASNFSIEWLIYFFVLFFVFYDRGMDFEYRAQNVPFAVALSELLFESKNSGDSESD